MSPSRESSRSAAAVIVAAGRSSRMGQSPGDSKLLFELGGVTVLARSLLAFESTAGIDEIILVSREEHAEEFQRLAADAGISKLLRVVSGGETRSASVCRGVAAVSAHHKWVAVHDAARPLISPSTIAAALSCAEREGSALVAIPSRDTLKESSDGRCAERTIDRDRVWIAQTPQVFPREELLKLLELAREDASAATDESALWEEHHGPVAIVQGAAANAKLTTPEDLAMAQAWLNISAEEPS
jgi:2-C-methyl-D-erythritol 4-phosphate cytidylyltransferase